MLKFLVRSAVLAAAVAGVKTLLEKNPKSREALDRATTEARTQAKHAAGTLKGKAYQMRGAHPDADVADPVLADRVRSTLGPLEKRLDVPRVHVTVEGGHVRLHGDVPSVEAATELERAAAEVSGVTGVTSSLVVGLARGTTRPSESRDA